MECGFNEIQKITEDVLKENQPDNIIELIYGYGVEITIDPAWHEMTFPKVITLHFGDGIIDVSGNYRAGLIEIHATGMY